MKTLNDIGLLFKRYALQLLRDPVWLFVGLSTPVLYLLLFTPLLNHLPLPGAGKGHAIDGFLPGILALQAFASGAGPGFGTIFELKSGLTERLRVTPASRLALLLGPVLFATVAMYFFDLLLVLVGILFGFDARWAGLGILVVLLGLLMVTMASFSVALAIVTKEISAFASVVTGLNLPVLLLAGVLLPISLGRVAESTGPFQPSLLLGRSIPLTGQRGAGHFGHLAGVCRPGAVVRLDVGLGHEGVPSGGGIKQPPSTGRAAGGGAPISPCNKCAATQRRF